MTSADILMTSIQEPVPFTEAVTPACLPSISPRLREDKVRVMIIDDDDDDDDDVPCSSRRPRSQLLAGAR